MTVSIDDIKKLREMTGVSMTLCKKALDEADGDLDAAIDLLRKKGEAKSAERSERATNNGAVVIKSDGNKAAMLMLLCETDFVSRGDDFISLLNDLSERVFSGELATDATDIQELKDAAQRLGENLQLAEMTLVEGSVLGTYVHSNKQIGVLVSLEGGNEELARDLSMHVAATNPSVVSPEEISEDLVAKEKEIWTDQLKGEGKPEEIIEKIMMGKEKKFREENALLKQAFVKDPDKTIEQLLEEAGAKIVSFTRYSVC